MKKLLLLFSLVLSTQTSFSQWKQAASKGGYSWRAVFQMDVVDSNKVLIFVQPTTNNFDGLLLTTDMGNNWKEVGFPTGTTGYLGINSVSMINDGSVWVAFGGKIFANTTKDPYSNNWKLQFNNPVLTDNILYVKMFNSLHGIAMGAAKDMNSPAIFLQTKDGGQNWDRTDRSQFIGGTLSICDPVIKFFDKNVGYVLFYKMSAPNIAGPDSLYKTTNGGKDWIAIKTQVSPLGCVRVFSEDVIANWWNDLSVSTDGGKNWIKSKPSYTTSCRDFWLDQKNTSLVWSLGGGTIRGIFYSTNKGEYFNTAYGIGASYEVSKMQIYNNKFGFVLGINGFYSTSDINYYTTDIIDNKEIPINYSLEQNYPNPFNPSTKISYVLPKAGFVSLKIYDQLGSEIITLVNEFKNAGSYDNQFSISNSTLSSGIYFYTLKVGDFVQTKKMILMK